LINIAAAFTGIVSTSARRGHLPLYRAFSIYNDRIVGPPIVLTCDDDEEAIEQARKLVTDSDIELWQLGRLIIRLRPAKPP
jgi:hypothetical protein